jgi:DNA-binding transcriptional MocR family regulator
VKDKRLYRTTRFATVPDWLIGKVSLSALGVYVALDRLTFPDGKSSPSRREIAAKISVSETTVKKAVGELERAGAVERRERVVDGTQQPNEYVLRRDPPGSEYDPPGSGSAPSRASSRGEAREPNERPPVGPPIGSVDRVPVTTGEHAMALLILDAFNDIFGTTLRSVDHLRKIIMRIREYPEMTLPQHRDVIARNARSPWWKGKATPSVIYGNGALFERAMLVEPEDGPLSAADAAALADAELGRDDETIEGEATEVDE